MAFLRCTLCDVQPLDAEWSDQALEFFESFIFETDSRVLEYVSSVGDHVFARLFDENTGDSLSDMLVTKGFARIRNVSPINSPGHDLDTAPLAQDDEPWDDELNKSALI